MKPDDVDVLFCKHGGSHETWYFEIKFVMNFAVSYICPIL